MPTFAARRRQPEHPVASAAIAIMLRAIKSVRRVHTKRFNREI
jgi:hypothetical protein